MSLFRHESPQLGLNTTVHEISGSAADPVGAPLSNDYRPVVREIVNQIIQATPLEDWMFIAPSQCQIVQAKVVLHLPATTAITLQAYVVPLASQPEAPTAGNQVFSAAQSVSSATATADTVFLQTLTTSVDNLILNAGDMIGFNISGAATGLNGLLQIEVVRLQ